MNKLVVLLFITHSMYSLWGVNQKNAGFHLDGDTYTKFSKTFDKYAIYLFSNESYITTLMENTFIDIKGNSKFDGKVPFVFYQLKEDSKLLKKYNTTKLPALVFFNKGFSDQYNNIQDVEEWYFRHCKKQLLRNISGIDELDEISTKFSFIVYTKEKNKKLDKNIQTMQIKYLEHFYITTSEEIREHYNIKNNYAVIILKDFDERTIVREYSNRIKLKELNRLYKLKRRPYVILFNQDEVGDYLHEIETFFIYLSKDLQSEQYQAYAQFAQQNEERLFFKTDLGTKAGIRFGRIAGIRRYEDPIVMIFHWINDQIIRFKYEGDITLDNLNLYLKEFVEGNLKPFKKSQDIPEQNNGPVKVLVTNTIDDFMTDRSKFRVILYYDDEDENSELQKEILDLVAVECKDIDKLLFARIEATMNEVSIDSLADLPDLRLYDRSNGIYQSYVGEWKQKDIVQFVRKEIMNLINQKGNENQIPGYVDADIQNYVQELAKGNQDKPFMAGDDL